MLILFLILISSLTSLYLILLTFYFASSFPLTPPHPPPHSIPPHPPISSSHPPHPHPPLNPSPLYPHHIPSSLSLLLLTTPTGKKPFFNWISADSLIATARGAGGGLALWQRDVELQEKNKGIHLLLVLTYAFYMYFICILFVFYLYFICVLLVFVCVILYVVFYCIF